MTPIPFIAVVALLTAGGLEEYGLPAVAPVAADAPVAAVAAPEARPYDETADASEAVAAAMTRAALADKRVVVVMGANWCHDSRALAGWFATPRFAEMLDSRYEVVFVDAGHPATGDLHNAAIARRFGLKTLKGTPTVFVAAPDGTRLNSKKDASSWRNAASRDEDAIFAYFDSFGA
ncbi:thioredoxin family protein [Sphingorhabdus soli]|uniref:Thioredoxin family protein n=1 Tax=Flavisphingopyxis soli TaxID=2601267 RepID=A0A5C6U8W1_9SPHN|nr:thioredoxin family protein [Sphingorhabdus soli]TXC68216.1 thioredoxin family protein [Sphingorhabdus soli]